jgi:hypothetical protein
MCIGVVIIMVDTLRVFGLQIAHAKWLDIDQRLMYSTIGDRSFAGACAVFGHGWSIGYLSIGVQSKYLIWKG